MRNLIRTLALLPALALPACGGGDSGPDAEPADLGREFVLAYGETIDVGPMTLKFIAVVEEQRCPINAMCVSAGNARIQLAVTSRRAADILELNTGFGPSVAVFDEHVIELRHLDPLPAYPYPAPSPDTYRATLLVDGQMTPAS